MASKAAALTCLWQGLQGTWQLKRKLHSMDAAEPSGICLGQAILTSRQPAIFVDGDGKLQNASKEMLYSEQGDFEMNSANNAILMPKFTFSRKYVWRLQNEASAQPEISVWFVKPGTEQIDYLFHKFQVQDVTTKTVDGDRITIIECRGGHLCVEDYYSSTYTFSLDENTRIESSEPLGILSVWKMHHEVRGPKKDQIIETDFTRA